MELDTWSECRMAGQEWELVHMGSPDPEGPQLKCVHRGSSRNRTGCSEEPGRSREGHGLCWSGSDRSQACGLRWSQVRGGGESSHMDIRPPQFMVFK